MHGAIRALLLTTTLVVAGCQDKAAQILDTAQFEELQHNPQHARELYEQIIADYPNSEQATRARERLVALKTQPE